jgi:membrane protease YdiL (CAAX protease family)
MPGIILILRTTWKIVWRAGLFFIGWAALLALFFVPFGSRFGEWHQNSPFDAQLYSDIVTAVTIVVVTWLMTRFIDRRPFRTIGFTFNHIMRDFLIGTAVGSAWIAVSIGTVWLLGWGYPLLPVGFSLPALIIASTSMLFNVVTQELILCGFVFQTIRDKSNVIIAILVQSILFCALHAAALKGEILPAVNVFAAGLLFCLAYIMTDNLWFPISIHYAWDVLLGPVLGLTESGKNNLGGGWKMFFLNGPPLFTGGKFGLEGGLIVTISLFLIIPGMILISRHKYFGVGQVKTGPGISA